VTALARFNLLAGSAVLALALTACSSAGASSSSGESSAAASQAGSGTAAASSGGGSTDVAALVAQGEKLPAVPTIAPLSKRPPTGKTMTFVTCPIDICVVGEKSAQQAAESLGWKVTVIQGGLTPQDQVAAWNQAVQAKPDGIIGILTVPTEIIASQIAAAKAAGIPLVTIAGDQPAGNGITASIAGPEDIAAATPLVANWVAQDSNGSANVVVLTEPAAKNFSLAGTKFTDELKRVCPGCTADNLDFNQVDIGTKIPTQVVSYLQSHPDVKYVMAALGAATTGVRAALNAAGLSDVKIVSRGGGAGNFAALANGSESVTTGEGDVGYEVVDVLARQLVGDPISDELANPIDPYQLLTKDNIGDTKTAWVLPGLNQAYTKAWQGQ
jgi:ABC-type sugar transport system substrate-binding protein